MGAERGTIAFGRPAFVAGAAIGSAIGNAVRQNTAYNACMEAQGFVAVDELQKTAVTPSLGSRLGQCKRTLHARYVLHARGGVGRDG